MSQYKLNALKLANIRKSRDDVRRLRDGMRFVITLEGGQVDNLFESTEYRIIQNYHYIGNGIAVLGPALVHGVFIPDALLCEISLSRGSLYATAERQTERPNLRSGRRLKRSRYLKERRRIRKLEPEELHLLWPTLEAVNYEMYF
ncbi:MAG: hypothetical protein HZA95_03145 [Candidatus Vogelbacteria bacterium]|nr:hypothetical protein [Candidatus Vogelbacteria bacterium]